MARSRKVCLITPNHICTNPRLVKEAKALAGAGYRVHLIFTQESRSSAAADQIILAEHPQWTYTKLDWTGDWLGSKWRRIQSGIIQKLAKAVSKKQLTGFWCYRAVNRHYRWQLSAAKRVDASLYIAHNLGALPVAKKAAGEKNILAGFDAEDFHRQENENGPEALEFKISTHVEDVCLQSINHFTAASPLIAAEYQKLYSSLKPDTILNVFPRLVMPPAINNDKPLRLFWFSQTIGPNRGIESIIEAVSKSGIYKFEVHLVGNLNESFRLHLQTLCKLFGIDFNRIIFYGTVSEADIFKIAHQCDVGLATETGKPYNRDICLTNKIFTYIQSGLAVIASDTKAQAQLIHRYPQIGSLYPCEDVTELAEKISFFDHNRMALNKCKDFSYNLGQTELNWEIEGQKFVSIIDDVFK